MLDSLLLLSSLFLETEISSGARLALPMGVAPEAIVESFLSIGSSRLCFPASLRSCFFCIIISSGARLALPIVVAPKAIVKSAFLGIDSKISAP
jgi:hypothetical protein